MFIDAPPHLAPEVTLVERQKYVTVQWGGLDWSQPAADPTSSTALKAKRS